MVAIIFFMLCFCIFVVIFPYFWSFAFYSVKFLEIKNIYKILIIFSILALILFSAYYSYYFTEIGWLFGSFFAAGLVAVPFYLWMWYKAEKEEKDNALIQRMPTLQDYFNKNKKRFITNKKIFFIGLFGVFVSIWQIEVPQTIIVDLLPVKLEIVNDDFEYIENPKQNFSAFIQSNLDFEEEKIKRFLNFTYSKINIYACDDFDCKGDKKYVGFYWEPWSYASTLGCISLSGSCNRSIERNKRGRDYLMSFIENKNQKNKRKNNE